MPIAESSRGAYFDLGSGFSGVNPVGAIGRYPSFLFWECVTSESHEHTSTVTEHPVEAGANISDHYRTELDKLELDMWLSNEPIDYNSPNGIAAQYGGFLGVTDLSTYKRPIVAGAQTPNTFSLSITNNVQALLTGGHGNPLSATAQVLQFTQRFNRLADVHKMLEQLRNDAYVFSVITKAAVYPSMVIEKWSMKRDAQSGTGAGISVSLKQLRLVETKSVQVPQPVQPRGQLPKNNGTQQPKAVTATDDRSFAAFLYDAATGSGK
jgi:hypothetical protein